MYIPKAFQETDPELLRAFIRQHGFGTLVTHASDGIHVSHVPMLLDGETVLGHLAAANPQCTHLAEGAAAVCIFQGPHGYVSPTWYQAPGVPTWNYAAVHAEGRAEAVTDKARLRKIVEALAAQYEQDREPPWQADYPERMLEAIVGFRIPIASLEGKFKLSQNRTAADRRGVVEALERSDHAADAELAALMRQRENASK